MNCTSSNKTKSSNFKPLHIQGAKFSVNSQQLDHFAARYPQCPVIVHGGNIFIDLINIVQREECGDKFDLAETLSQGCVACGRGERQQIIGYGTYFTVELEATKLE